MGNYVTHIKFCDYVTKYVTKSRIFQPLFNIVQ